MRLPLGFKIGKRRLKHFGLAFIIASAMTAFLFWGMQAMILSGKSAMDETPRGSVLDFIQLKPQKTPPKKDNKPKKPPKPSKPPPKAAPPSALKSNPNALAGYGNFGGDISADISLDGNAIGSDGDLVPLIKGEPSYPRFAQSRGIEGYVIVEFTVTKLGTVKNVSVVESEPDDIFDQAAVDAAKKFRYQPRKVNGQAVDVAGIQNKIVFQIED